ncbi:MAG: hypothetical protein AAF370_15550, partial [Pseudomonadota bacterium]
RVKGFHNDPFGQRLCAIYTALNVLDLEPLNRQTFALSRWHTDRCKNAQQRSTGPSKQVQGRLFNHFIFKVTGSKWLACNNTALQCTFTA